MNKALPKTKETALELKEMLNQERDGKRQNRLQALYLIASKQAKSRTQIAALLGKSRNTISNWLSLYEESGLEEFLEIYKPAGAKTKISKAALADIKAILASDKGSRTYKEIHQMVVRKHSIDIHYSNVHHLVRYKLVAKAKVPRPANPKKT
jgi:transposase